MKQMACITVDKSVLKEVLKLLGMKNLKCASCGKRITVANYGFIYKDGAYCKSLICIMDAVETLEARGIELATTKLSHEPRPEGQGMVTGGLKV